MREIAGSQGLRCLVHRPAVSPPAEGYPVLVFLHGYDEAAPMDITAALTLHGPLAPTAAPIARERFVILAPQLPVAGDLWGRFGSAVVDLVEREVASDCDAARIYLSGFSFGGNGVFDLAIASPDRWAALWAVDPTRVPVDPRLPVWLSVGEIARRRLSMFSTALGLSAPGQDPLDRTVLDQGEDHVGSARRAYADPAIYEWLLTYKASR